MKKASSKTGAKRRPKVREDDILPEYDFSRARPNPYAAKLRGRVIAVVLEPDVARAFPTSAAVNHALREITRNGGPRATKTKRRRRTA